MAGVGEGRENILPPMAARARIEALRLDRIDIAVLGGGIGGLALALALTRRGFRCRVFEKDPAFGESLPFTTTAPSKTGEGRTIRLSSPESVSFVSCLHPPS